MAVSLTACWRIYLWEWFFKENGWRCKQIQVREIATTEGRTSRWCELWRKVAMKKFSFPAAVETEKNCKIDCCSTPALLCPNKQTSIKKWNKRQTNSRTSNPKDKEVLWIFLFHHKMSRQLPAWWGLMSTCWQIKLPKKQTIKCMSKTNKYTNQPKNKQTNKSFNVQTDTCIVGSFVHKQSEQTHQQTRKEKEKKQTNH